MKSKHFIALFFLLVLCIQVLPIKQIGAMLSGNQANEEVPHSPEDCKGDAAKFEFSKYDPFLVHDNTYTHPFLTGVQQYIHFAYVIEFGITIRI